MLFLAFKGCNDFFLSAHLSDLISPFLFAHQDGAGRFWMEFALLSDEASRSIRFLYVRTRARGNDAKAAKRSRPLRRSAEKTYRLTDQRR